MFQWLKRPWRRQRAVAPTSSARAHCTRLMFEQLEDRTAPSADLLSDINTGPTASAPTFLNGERWFTEITLSNGQTRIFFVANNGQRGDELWMTDGTPGNAQLVRDIRDGPGSSSPRFLTNVNGILFFAADDGQSGFELWRSDGTNNGTTRVRDLRSGGSSDPRFLVNVDGTLFFAADDGQTGFELWRSDGTSAGTTRVADINQGAGSSNPHWLLNADGVLYFSADSGSGYRLHWYDPTTNTLDFVRDPPPLSGINITIRNPQWLAYFPGLDRLYFVAWELGNGVFQGHFIYYTPLRSIAPPTRVMSVSDPGNQGFFLTAVKDPTLPATQGNFLLFRNGPILTPVLQAFDAVNPPPVLGGVVTLDADPFDLYNHNGVLVYSAGADREPWYIDTRGRTLGALNPLQLGNINPTGSSLLPPLYFPRDFNLQRPIWDYLGNQPTWYHWQSQVFFTSLGNLLYFAANDGSRGVELWKAREDLSGVNIVLTVNGTEIAPGARSANPRFLIAAAGSIVFSASGTDPNTNSNVGEEPWVEIGPPRIVSVNPSSAGTYRMRQVMQFIVQMDKPTLVTGTPRLQLRFQDFDSPSMAAKDVFAVYTSGSGSTQLVFRYTVMRGDRDKDGLWVVGPLDLSTATITNLVGDRGDGQFWPSPQQFPNVLVDGFTPWVIQVHGPRVGTYGPGSTLTFQLITSEAVSITPSNPTNQANQVPPYLNVRIGNNTRRANLVSASAGVLTFRYKVQAGDYAPNGIYLDIGQPLNLGTYSITAPSIHPPEASAPSGPRPLDVSFRVPVFAGVFVDTRGPRIAAIQLPGLRNYVTGEVLEFRFRFDEKVYLRGSSSAQPSLRLQIGSAIRQAALVSGLGTNTLTFRYTVQASDQDLDGIRLLDIALPSGTRLTDLVGNVAPLAFTPPDTRLIRINVPTIRL